MQGVRFDKDSKTYEVISAPILNGDSDLVVIAVEIEAGELATIKVDDIKKLKRPEKPKLDS